MATQLLLIAAFVASMIIMSLNYKKRKKKVMFISGASIELALASGSYFYQLLDILQKENVDDKYELLKLGIRSGNIHEVFEKIEAEALDKGPDIVIINFTTTDMMDWLTVEKREFDAFYNSIIKRLIDSKIAVIVCLPLVSEDEKNHASSNGIEWSKYFSVMSDCAIRNNVSVINMQRFNLMNSGEEANSDKTFAIEIWKALRAI